jgi:uncharacterized protein
VHARFKPVLHQFRYRLFYACVVLDELPRIPRHLPLLFGYNTRWRPFSISDADYLGAGPGTIRDKLLTAARLHVRGLPLSRVSTRTRRAPPLTVSLCVCLV